MDPEILGLAGANELPRTGLPYLPSLFAGVSLIGLGQAARAAGRGRRSA